MAATRFGLTKKRPGNRRQAGEKQDDAEDQADGLARVVGIISGARSGAALGNVENGDSQANGRRTASYDEGARFGLGIISAAVIKGGFLADGPVAPLPPSRPTLLIIIVSTRPPRPAVLIIPRATLLVLKLGQRQRRTQAARRRRRRVRMRHVPTWRRRPIRRGNGRRHHQVIVRRRRGRHRDRRAAAFTRVACCRVRRGRMAAGWALAEGIRHEISDSGRIFRAIIPSDYCNFKSFRNCASLLGRQMNWSTK